MFGRGKFARARETLSSWCARWGRPGCRLMDQKGQRSKRGLRAFQCRIQRRRLNTASIPIPTTKTITKPGSGTTRISASFACADSRRQVPCAGLALSITPKLVRPRISLTRLLHPKTESGPREALSISSALAPSRSPSAAATTRYCARCYQGEQGKLKATGRF